MCKMLDWQRSVAGPTAYRLFFFQYVMAQRTENSWRVSSHDLSTREAQGVGVGSGYC